MRPISDKQGFSLVELLITIAIISILAAIAIPQYIKYVKRTRTSEAIQHTKSIYNALLEWYSHPSLGDGTFLKATTDLGRSGEVPFSTHFPSETAWIDSGDKYYTWIFTSTNVGEGLIPRATGTARNAETVFGEVIITGRGGEAQVSRVSASY